MTGTGYVALDEYVVAVSGYAMLAPCVQSPYAAAFGLNIYENCQIDNAAAVYASCLCSKDGEALQSLITSAIFSAYKCTNGETSTALSVYSAFCSSATMLAEKIGTSALSYCEFHNRYSSFMIITFLL